jgi:hypothetical protein
MGRCLLYGLRGSRFITIRIFGDGGGRGPITRGFGSFPPASEREARMDDPRSGHA